MRPRLLHRIRRRFVGILMLASFFVAQWAAIPHAHSSNDPLAHDATPHLHLGGARRHSHAHPSVDRHELATSPFAACDVEDHDADACTLPATTALMASESANAIQHLTTPTEEPYASRQLLITLLANQSEREHPLRDECAPHCALYLALRTLRI